MRSIVYARRVAKEILRDPLSYVFCLGFPIFMLILFTVINSSVPAEAKMSVFEPESITPGIGMFGLSFVMLFVAIQISKDRDTSLLARLYTSPMTAVDFVLGYSMPAFVIAVAQMVICFVSSAVIGLFTGTGLPLAGSVLSIVSLIPSAVMFIAMGILAGSLMNDKAAPAVTSIAITAAAILGGVWMPLDSMEGLRRICAFFPFYHSVEAARAAMQMQLNAGGLLVVAAYMLVLGAAAIMVFRKKMKS